MRSRIWLALAGLALLLAAPAMAQTPARGAALPVPNVNIGVQPARSPGDVSMTLQILLLLTVLTLAPSILMMMTSFTRIIIVLSFVRNALGTQQIPPNQVLTGLALFLTFFSMSSVLTRVNDRALQPYMAGRISFNRAIREGEQPIRDFMFRQTREMDLALFIKMSNTPRPRTRAEVPTLVLIPSFIISELKTAFAIGLKIYLPFLVIDMVVASVLMSMGMMMLPPMMISLPAKLLLFVMIDGWHLLARSLIGSFM
ncbi:MAG: flagellar type III secretion system pore protein FliP [Armatimonadetes bacterium]|nr:flagellar type III secretion system pore protein FliP [Armatimonadota bacterium]